MTTRGTEGAHARGTGGAGLALPVSDPDLEARLRSRLEEVEKALYGHVQSRFPYVTAAASHLLDAGGKRFRPLLVLLAAEAGDHPDVDDVATAACVVEITHLGSLYHDDVMDEADLRRGAVSANARWDNLVAILTGDFLFAKSSELTAQLGADAVRIQAETFSRLVEGQILETVEPGPDEDPLAHYLEVVAGKTGSLIATSARYGARFGSEDGRVPATFEVIFLTGWAPAETQQKPLRPGSAVSRLADALGAEERSAGERAGATMKGPGR